MPRPFRVQLRADALETRETPAAGAVESFDAVAPPALPSGWIESSNDGTNVFDTKSAAGVGGTTALAATGGSRTSGFAWNGTAVSGGTGVAATVKLDSLAPTFVFARGSALDSNSPTYLAATITRGVTLNVVEVANGVSRTLGSVASPSTSYFSANWARVSLIPNGNSVAVQVQRLDNGCYLTPQGTWQAAAVNALLVTTALPTTTGYVGVGRTAAYSGTVALDNVVMITPTAPSTPPTSPGTEVQQNFDGSTVGSRPSDWSGWSSDSSSAFSTTNANALSGSNGFRSTGGSASAARAWSDADLAADVQASASVYLDTLVPAQLFVRGSNLNASSATYYAVNITRGLQADLVKVVNGVSTSLGSINSTSYFSLQWLRVTLSAEGSHLRVLLYRADTQQWLDADGAWSSSPDYAFDKTDASIAGGGKAGVGRAALYAGTATFDDFSAEELSAVHGPVITITPSQFGNVMGDVAFTAAATGVVSRIEFRLDNQLRSTSATSPAAWTFDSTTAANGVHILTVRAYDSTGNFTTKDLSFTIANPDSAPVPKPDIPQHYSWIRIAQLAYSGTPIGAFEQTLLRNSVDVVVPNPTLLQSIQNSAPNTPQLVYTNVSNLYEGLLGDWMDYARRNAVDPDLAFYHVTQATPFTGASSSSQPVTWFWSGYQSLNGVLSDQTSAVRGGRATNLNLGASGTWTAIGNLDKFREINVTLGTAAQSGWSGAWEYVSAVDANGNPTAWKTLTLKDGTAAMKSSGTITFDPPSDWAAASIGGSPREFYVRLRATAGTAAQAPQLRSAMGRDYVRANGGTSGVIPAFDYSADKDHDGYLSDAEYANRAAGKDARFVYETRLFYPGYGQMRFVTNPSSSAIGKWAVEYHQRLIAQNPLADGFFMDNAHGKVPFSGISVLEPTTTYSDDSGAMVAAINRAISPKWIMSNTAGGTTEGDGIAAGSAAVMEEFLLRPLATNWAKLGDTANLVAGRLNADGSPYVVLDSLPIGGSPTDPRTQLATLAEYYLFADPKRTFLMFYGGYSPSSSWTQHWSQAAAVNVGKPTGTMQLFASGADPTNSKLTYRVYSRSYENALVLYKPLSYATGVGDGTLANATATTHQLAGKYRQVNSDGSLGPVISSITLRNGEGAILVKA
jgi:hypothetical protein